MTEPTSPPNTPASPAAWTGSDDVYASTYRQLLRVAYLLTGSAAAAEDVVHDVFCTVGPRLASLEQPGVYLRVAVVNRCRSLHRRATRAPVLDRPVDAQLDPGLTELRDELARLPLKQRSAVVLRYLCDLSFADIAATLDCRESTVRSLIHRGLTHLRHNLTQVTSP